MISKNHLNQDPFIAKMLEEVYEHETSMKNWDSSFIESVRTYYYEKGGLTDKQLEAVERKYNNLNSRSGSTYGKN